MTAPILIVDDSPQNLLVASRHLESAGHRVVTRSSGEQALALLESDRFDLVILDVLMPGIGGFETCRRIRANAAFADVPVMFMTALGDRDATAPALDAGADDLLAKPFTRSELLLRTSALIRQHRAVQKHRADTADERAKILASVSRLREISRGLDGEIARKFCEELANLEHSCERV
ncbi:MAG: response regulator [Myxococcota bacterium]|nr:response regulator [Deltaproteobacteria bacterium]MDQ3340482.1 response regulator [Myxococcota bacterium]